MSVAPSECKKRPGMCARDPLCEDAYCPGRYGFPTSRRHPRTMADAFPDVRRQFLERHEPLPIPRRIALFFRRFFA
jgi:hypothetical protein